MARSFSSAKLLSNTLANGFCAKLLSNRGFSAVVQAPATNVVRAGSKTRMLKQTDKKVSETSSWVPDPVTGYYRPENSKAEIDVAELRQVLLNQNIIQK